MGLKHQSSHGNIKAMAVRPQGHNQSQIFHKSSKTQFITQTSQGRRKTGCGEKENANAVSHVQHQNFMLQTQKLWGNADGKKQNALVPNSARVRPESMSRSNRRMFGANSLTRPASNTRENSKFRNERPKFNQTMKGPSASSSTQNLHKLKKYDDFLGTAHHH